MLSAVVASLTVAFQRMTDRCVDKQKAGVGKTCARMDGHGGTVFGIFNSIDLQFRKHNWWQQASYRGHCRVVEKSVPAPSFLQSGARAGEVQQQHNEVRVKIRIKRYL
jgi:hypothetical protein